MSEDLADRIEALDVVEVTQADREAAADVWRDYIARIGEVMAEKAIRKGISDDTIIVQAFARHRITALRLAETSAALPDDVAGLVEDAKQLAECLDYPDARRTVFGLIATLTAQARRIAELEAENVLMRDMIQQLGDRVADMFEQLIKGNWHDDHDHDVKWNKAMLDLKSTLKNVMQARADHLGYTARAALGGSTDV